MTRWRSPIPWSLVKATSYARGCAPSPPPVRPSGRPPRGRGCGRRCWGPATWPRGQARSPSTSPNPGSRGSRGEASGGASSPCAQPGAPRPAGQSRGGVSGGGRVESCRHRHRASVVIRRGCQTERDRGRTFSDSPTSPPQTSRCDSLLTLSLAALTRGVLARANGGRAGAASTVRTRLWRILRSHSRR